MQKASDASSPSTCAAEDVFRCESSSSDDLPKSKTAQMGSGLGDSSKLVSLANQLVDKYDLERFTAAHKEIFSQALQEIQMGVKSSGWMWYMFPTPPHVVHGVERGSAINRKYALRSDDEALAFLAFARDGINLRQNYMEILRAVVDQLKDGKRLVSLLGKMSAPKLASSVRLFERVSRSDGLHPADEELHLLTVEAIKLLELQEQNACR